MKKIIIIKPKQIITIKVPFWSRPTCKIEKNTSQLKGHQVDIVLIDEMIEAPKHAKS